MSNKIGNISRIVSFILMVSIIMFIGTNKVEAASFSITSGISSITLGDSYTISISAKGLTGRFNITHSSNVSVNVSSVWVENGKADSTIKVTTKKEGKATVTISPDPEFGVSNDNGLVSLDPKTDTVTVKAKSSGGGSSSGSGSSSNGSSGESSKPQAPSFTSVNETVYATDSVNVRSSYSTSSSVIGSLEKGDSVTRIGKSSSWSKVKYNGQTAYISSSYLTTEKPKEEKSNNKKLKSLEVENYKLSPEFNKDTTEYDLTIPDDVNSLEIKAVAEDKKSKVEITGNDKLLTGVNTIEIKVTAEDETVGTYKINVTKGETTDGETGLSEITVEGYTLSPEFSSNIHEYTLNIDDPSITSLNVDAKAFDENAKVEITGNDELKLGENIITILVTAEDGKKIYTYQIVVNITEKQEDNNQIIAGIDNNNLYMYIGIGVAVILVIIIIIVIVKRKNRDEDDFETYYGGFDSLNKKENDNKDDVTKDKLFGTMDTKYSSEANKIENQKDVDNKKDRRSVIEENFGAGIGFDNFDGDYDNTSRRKKGKHSK